MRDEFGIKEYHVNGRIEWEIPLTKVSPRRRHGTARCFYPDGTLKIEREYVHGKENGPEKIYYPDGKLWMESHFKDGLLSGPSRSWFKNGQLENDMEFLDGKRHGRTIKYNQDGTIFFDGVYDKGVRVESDN